MLMPLLNSIKSALKMRGETTINMKINEKHLFLIGGQIIRYCCLKKDKNILRLHCKLLQMLLI